MNGRRPVARWAWRMFRREWRQQLGVLVLMTVAVAAAVGGAAMAAAASADNGKVGDAKALIHVDNTDPAIAARVVAAARQRFGAIEVLRHTSSAVPGSPQRLDVRSQDPHGRFSHSLLALRSGHLPTKPDEIALTDGAAELLDARLGSRVALGGASRTVVGMVENPADLHDDFALLEPSSTAPADTLVLLAEHDPGSAPPPDDATSTTAGAGTDGSRDQSLPPFRVQAFGDAHGQVVALVLVVDTLAMALVCLVASAGFVVVAQRRQRQLGLLAAIGATDRHLRLAMVVNGAIVGVVAALGGAVLGFAGWAVAQPAVERAVSHRVETFALPWGLIGECLLAAVVAATAAAWWPARTMSKLPVMAALSRRPLRPRPVRRSLALALVISAVGMAALVYADPNDEAHSKPLFLIGGVLLLIVGMVLAAPGAVRLAAAPATRLPLAPRLALRDLARHQARAAAALAAIALGLGISVFVVGLASASVYDTGEGNLGRDQLLIRLEDVSGSRPTDQTDADRRAADAHAADIAGAIPDAAVAGLDLPFDPAAVAAGVPDPVDLGEPTGPHSFRGRGPLYVATPELLAVLGIDPTTVHGGTEVLTSYSADAHPELHLLDLAPRPATPGDTGRRDFPPAAVQRIDLPAYTAGPRSLITEAALAEHGWTGVRVAWLVQADHPISHDDLVAARRAAAAVGFSVEGRDAQDDLATLRTIATAVGVALALAIVALTLGLLRGEAAQDLRTLTATGARGRMRQGLTATTAGTLGLLGALMGTATAYVAMAAGYRNDLGQLLPLPGPQLAALLIGVPVLATAVGWLASGRDPATLSRQLLD